MSHTQGRFDKINPSVVRLQRLINRFSLYTQLQDQWSKGNVDSSEFSFGGASAQSDAERSPHVWAQIVRFF